MNFGRIIEIAKSLGVEEGDIKRIERRGSVNKLIYWVIGTIIVIISFIAGYLVGKRACSATSPHGYPFAGVGLTIPVLEEKRKSKVMMLVLSAFVFLLAIKSQPIFGQAIEYNVYSRK